MSDAIVTKKQQPHKALSPAFIRNVTEPGKYADGDCLFLMVTKKQHVNQEQPPFADEDLNKKFVQILTIHGRRRYLGMGSAKLVPLADVRKRAHANHASARTGGIR
jgi:hypothetical protein